MLPPTQDTNRNLCPSRVFCYPRHRRIWWRRMLVIMTMMAMMMRTMVAMRMTIKLSHRSKHMKGTTLIRRSPNDSTDQEKEPNASRMTALQTVTRNLLLSSRIERQNVDVNWVRRSSFSKNDFTTKECEVVARQCGYSVRTYLVKGPKGRNTRDVTTLSFWRPFCNHRQYTTSSSRVF
ncbi:MAG: hypothetical protein J3R72DRAFT_33318 [Linnemannia gamsii]|nr:MAG: hypothetical protein J3R72DRAFT_33318 [Linnemannia gamsii]